MCAPRLQIPAVKWLLAASLLWPAGTRAAELDELPEAATAEAKALAVVFDFDTDSCYPSPAVSIKGEMNGGLKPTGSLTGECRGEAQLDNSNTYYRKASIKKGGVEYAVHMYALYFKKDQFANAGFVEAGHRHDWEFALVWTTDGKLTHASVSAHGNVATEPKARLHFDAGKGETVKVVYHKDDIKTHAFRFAKPNEKAENHKKQWLTPTIVAWDSMKGDGVSNEQLRKKFNEHDFGSGNCSFNDKNFPNEIAKSPPQGYPTADDWRAAAKGG
jgi:hypothetical protein